MPSYLSLVNWTEQGIKNVKDSPRRLDQVKHVIEQAGGRLIFFYMTMGQYDLVTLMEVPNDEAAARVAIQLGMGGNVRTTTLKAFTEDEYRSIIGKL
ncbi:MAG: GYD domain-containing protein [SAR202 cluster bacterium]|nr:GYD domain-containing protein [SAR202 cluster bacterium]